MQHFRHFARAVLVMGLSGPAQSAWLSLALTASRPPGQRLLSFGFGSNDLFVILMGCVLLAIAVVMTQASALAEENAGFV